MKTDINHFAAIIFLSDTGTTVKAGLPPQVLLLFFILLLRNFTFCQFDISQRSYQGQDNRILSRMIIRYSGQWHVWSGLSGPEVIGSSKRQLIDRFQKKILSMKLKDQEIQERKFANLNQCSRRKQILLIVISYIRSRWKGKGADISKRKKLQMADYLFPESCSPMHDNFYILSIRESEQNVIHI